MRSLTIFSFLVTAASSLSLSTDGRAAGAFADCESARNQGLNSGEFFVKAAMGRVACDPRLLEAVEDMVASTARRQVALPTSDDDATKICFASGAYQAFAGTLESEVAKCQAGAGELEEARLRRLAKIASAVALGVDEVLAGGLTEDQVQSVFGLPEVQALYLQNRDSKIGCKAAVEAALHADAALRAKVSPPAPGLETPVAKRLLETVCGLAPLEEEGPPPKR